MPFADQARFYIQWRSLTDAEGAAIREDDWRRVSALQSAKSELQAAIVDAERREAGPYDAADLNHRRRTLSDLIAAERANLLSVDQLLEAARSRQAAAEKSRADLRRLRRHFGAPISGSWQRYS